MFPYFPDKQKARDYRREHKQTVRLYVIFLRQENLTPEELARMLETAAAYEKKQGRDTGDRDLMEAIKYLLKSFEAGTEPPPGKIIFLKSHRMNQRTTPRRRTYLQSPPGLPCIMEQDDKMPAASIDVKGNKIRIKTAAGTVKNPFTTPSK